MAPLKKKKENAFAYRGTTQLSTVVPRLAKQNACSISVEFLKADKKLLLLERAFKTN